jgi:hypothetical protein
LRDNEAQQARVARELKDTGQAASFKLTQNPHVRPMPDDVWPAEPDSKITLASFENLVTERRKSGKDISYVAAHVVSLSKDSLLIVADVLDAPTYVLFPHRPDKATNLQWVSNELALIRK